MFLYHAGYFLPDLFYDRAEIGTIGQLYQYG